MGVVDLSMRRAVFLDRDGVLNRAFIHDDGKSHPPASPNELEILPGVAKACMTLRQAGFLLIVVTNQPDVARGMQRQDVVEAINDTLCSQIPVDDIRACYHDDADYCACRKPKPGLLVEAANDLEIDLSNSFMVGNSWKDIEAGRRAGCKTVLVNFAGTEPKRSRPNFKAASLPETVDWILKHTTKLTHARRREL